jgi:hypothetical protein
VLGTGRVSGLCLRSRRSSSRPLTSDNADVRSFTGRGGGAGCLGSRLFRAPMRFIRCQRTRTPLTALATERISTVYISWR